MTSFINKNLCSYGIFGTIYVIIMGLQSKLTIIVSSQKQVSQVVRTAIDNDTVEVQDHYCFFEKHSRVNTIDIFSNKFAENVITWGLTFQGHTLFVEAILFDEFATDFESLSI
jgi:hypothetical protein